MSGDPILARVLDLVLRHRHDPHHQFVFVSSPPGGGKTRLVELVATTGSHLGLRVGIACPRAEQVFSLVRRLRQASPHQSIRLWVGRDRPVPADLRAQADLVAAGCYEVGPPATVTLEVGTVQKLAYLAAAGTVAYELLIGDEAYQVTLADLTPLLPVAERVLLVGDPGQLPPLVRIDPEPFAAARFRVHAPAARELRRHAPGSPHLQLPWTYRLPPDTAGLLQSFYPALPFRAAASPAQRRLTFTHRSHSRDPVDRALDLLARGASLVVLELPARMGAWSQVDPEVTALMVRVVERMLARGIAPAGGSPFTTQEIGCVLPHVASGEAVRQELDALQLPGGPLLVGTPEVWQGLERPVMIACHPLMGPDPVSAFALDPGRLCVSVSRHQFACVIVARAGIEQALQEYIPDSGARTLGSDDRVWRGIRIHLLFFQDLRRLGRIIPA